MTTAGKADLRSRPYETYASQHARQRRRRGSRIVCRRDIGPCCRHPAVGFGLVLVRSSPPVVHVLANAAHPMDWEVVSTCYQIALAAAMTSMMRGHIVTQNVTFAAARVRLP